MSFRGHSRSLFTGLFHILALATLCLSSPLSAHADIIPPPGFEALNYNVTLENGITGISDIVFLEETSPGRGWSWGYSLSPGSSSAASTWPLSFPPITATFAIGLAAGVPGDPNPTLAVFGNFTSNQIGEDFSVLFPDANESTLINDLTELSSFSSNEIGDFTLPIYTDAMKLAILTPPGGNFDVVAFSSGQLIGTGTLDVTTAPVSEPPAFSLLVISGAIMAGFAGLRRKTWQAASH